MNQKLQSFNRNHKKKKKKYKKVSNKNLTLCYYGFHIPPQDMDEYSTPVLQLPKSEQHNSKSNS